MILILHLAGFSTVWYGCAAPPDARGRPSSQAPDVPEPTSTVVDARPAALVQGRSITWGQLRPMLSELAGARVLSEYALDIAIEQAIEQAGIAISPADLDAERTLLQRTLHDDPDRSLRLLQQLRAREGLGPVRFNALLYRNAALRALVQHQVAVTDDAVSRMHDMTYGPKRQPRLMILSTLTGAQAALERLQAGEAFSDIAVELSSDASAARGGLLEPISRSDGSYPKALRDALWQLQLGEVSRPILLNDQYALLKLVREVPAEDVHLFEVRDEMHHRVRRQQERLLMDRLANEMIRNVSVTIFDDSLNESWRMQRQGRN